MNIQTIAYIVVSDNYQVERCIIPHYLQELARWEFKQSSTKGTKLMHNIIAEK